MNYKTGDVLINNKPEWYERMRVIEVYNNGRMKVMIEDIQQEIELSIQSIEWFGYKKEGDINVLVK